VAEVAWWFVDQATFLLHWNETNEPEPCCSEEELKRWADLTSRCLWVAAHAARLAKSESSVNGASQQRDEEAYLLGMVHAAPDWLSSCGVALSVDLFVDSPLPPWLTRALRDIHPAAPPPADSALGP